MKKYCEKCKKEFSETSKKCPLCGKRLKKILTEQEQKELQQQNDDFTVIHTMFL
ncbi:MAG: hypothetical protein IJV50_08045 [Lachnospiraceae bacterium]|nr:hypothetical protein [Lachnospiraceae bacterium]